MRGPRHRAALALLAILTSADVARAFTPTADDRYIQAIPGPVPMRTAVPFQPFDESLQIIVLGVQLGGAAQKSSIPADGIVGAGGAAAGSSPSSPVPPSAASFLDVHFDLEESSVFSLSASVSLVQSLPGGGFFQLERTAPSAGTFVTLSGVGEVRQRIALSPGSYRLRASASGGGNTGGSFDFEFRLVCASANPQDGDADSFVDACDICPLDFDPGQEDSDYDGIGDACDVPEVIEQILDPTVYAVLGPTRAALAPDGTAYVVSATNSRIFQIPPPPGRAPELWRGAPLGANVVDVALGPGGFVYTAGGTAAKCYRIDPITGASTLVIGPTGDGLGHGLTFANRVAVAPDGRVFVSGRDSRNVFEIAVGGAITLIAGPSGNGSTALGTPQALEVDDAGNVYVLAADNGNPRLFRVTPFHQIQLVLDPFSFLNPGSDLALGPDGSIYVAGDGIFARRPSGTLDEVLPLDDPRNAFAVDVDASGVVHAVDQVQSTGFRVTPARQIGPLIGSDGDGEGHMLQSASDVVVSDGPEKRIVVVGTLSNNAFLIADESAPAVVPLFGPAGWGALALALLGVPARSRWRRRARGIAALALLVVLSPASVARAFTPTQDDRSIHVTMATPSDTLTPVPFQPFSEGLFLFTAGQVVATAYQDSSFVAEGVVGEGSAYVEGIVAPLVDASSILDVRFDLSEGSAFSLHGSLRLAGPPFASATFLLERLAPNPAVLISQSGASVPALLDQLVGMPAGSYRLRAAAEAVLPGSSGQAFYDFDFQRTCSSANPQDSDGDAFVDACDLCPLNFDPDQSDTDGDGFGDACNDAVDADGDDYADALDNCPAEYNPDQIDADYDQDGDACDDPEVITLILDPTENVVQNPARAALASNGTAYVVSVTNSRIYRIPPPAGPAVQLWSGAPLAANVADVAVGQDHFVYTAGGTPAKCYRIDPSTGASTLVIDASGDGQGNVLTFANRVAVAPDGRVFVSGRDSQNVFEIAVGGTITQILGPSGDGTTSLGQPRALDVDADGNLYVLSTSGSNERLFRVTPGHQVELLMSSSAFPNGISAGDLALGPDGSVYVSGGGVLARRPSGTVDVLLASGNATALDVDAVGVVHVVQSAAPTHGFRIPPTGPIGPLIDASGDGQGHPLQSASEVVVSEGPEKRIVVVGTLSNNAFLITDVSTAVVPLLGPAGWGALALALLGASALARRR